MDPCVSQNTIFLAVTSAIVIRCWPGQMGSMKSFGWNQALDKPKYFFIYSTLAISSSHIIFAQTNKCVRSEKTVWGGSFAITALNHDVTVQVASQEQPVCSQTMSKCAQQGLACSPACARTEMD